MDASAKSSDAFGVGTGAGQGKGEVLVCLGIELFLQAKIGMITGSFGFLGEVTFFFSVVNTRTLFSPFVVADGFAFSSVV